MKTLVLAVFIVALSSCNSDSEWGFITLPADQITLRSIDNDSLYKEAVVPLYNGDTIFISNTQLLYRICYLKVAYPEDNIIVEYNKKIDKEGNVQIEPRFIKRHAI